MTFVQKYRSLFISDLHLGSHNCKVDRLLRFLRQTHAERIYLVGDIIESHHLKYWPKHHHSVVRLLVERSLRGVELIYIPGNHDALLRHHYGVFGNLLIYKNYSHLCVDGSILFLTHGDEVDFLPNYLWLWFITLFEKITRLSLWKFCRKVMPKVIEKHTQHFENKMRALGHDNILCGHIHYPKLSKGYYNCGDFIEHCTAIVEHYDGKFELLRG